MHVTILQHVQICAWIISSKSSESCMAKLFSTSNNRNKENAICRMQLHPVANSENMPCINTACWWWKNKTKGYDKDEEKMLNFNLKKKKTNKLVNPPNVPFFKKTFSYFSILLVEFQNWWKLACCFPFTKSSRIYWVQRFPLNTEEYLSPSVRIPWVIWPVFPFCPRQ